MHLHDVATNHAVRAGTYLTTHVGTHALCMPFWYEFVGQAYSGGKHRKTVGVPVIYTRSLNASLVSIPRIGPESGGSAACIQTITAVARPKFAFEACVDRAFGCVLNSVVPSPRNMTIPSPTAQQGARFKKAAKQDAKNASRAEIRQLSAYGSFSIRFVELLRFRLQPRIRNVTVTC